MICVSDENRLYIFRLYIFYFPHPVAYLFANYATYSGAQRGAHFSHSALSLLTLRLNLFNLKFCIVTVIGNLHECVVLTRSIDSSLNFGTCTR